MSPPVTKFYAMFPLTRFHLAGGLKINVGGGLLSMGFKKCSFICEINLSISFLIIPTVSCYTIFLGNTVHSFGLHVAMDG